MYQMHQLLMELEITFGHQPFSDYFQGFGRANTNLLGQFLLHILNEGKPIIVYKNVPTFSEWLTNF